MYYLSKNSKNWTPGTPASRICIGLFITVTAFLIRSAMHRLVQPHVPFHFAVAAAIVTEFFVGSTVAFLSLAIGMVLAFYYFIQPFEAFTALTNSDVIIIVNNLIVAVTAIIFLEYLQRANYSTKLTSQVAGSQRRSLIEVYNQVLFQQRKSQGFVKDITSIFATIGDVLLLMPAGQEPYPMPALYRLTQWPAHSDDQMSWQAMFHLDDVAMLKDEFYALAHPPVHGQKALRFRLKTSVGGERWVDGVLKSIHYRQQWRMCVLTAKDQASPHRRADDLPSVHE